MESPAPTETLFPKKLSIVATALTGALAVGVALLIGYMNRNFREVHQEQFPILEMASINVRLINTINLRMERALTSPDRGNLEELRLDLDSLGSNLKDFRTALSRSTRFGNLALHLASDQIITETNWIVQKVQDGKMEDARRLHASADYQKLDGGFTESVADVTEALSKLRDDSLAQQLRFIRFIVGVSIFVLLVLGVLYVRIYRAYRFNFEKRLEAEKQRKQLIYILCHDLGNPIASISGFVGYTEKDDPAKRAQAASMIRKSAVQAQSIIDMVRKMQALESGKLALEMNGCNLAELIHQAIDILSERAAQKRVELVVTVDPSLEVNVEKTSFVNSVVNNLLSNAIKFSQPDSKVEITAAKNDSGWVELEVRDHGIGMPANLVPLVFNEAKVTSRKGTSGEAGTGFGMPLARKFVLAYGGEISIQSSEAPEDHGTGVRVKLKAA